MKRDRKTSEEEITDDQEKEQDAKVPEPEVLSPEEDPPATKPGAQPLANREQTYALRELPSKPSNWPWVNRFRKKGVETFTEVIRAENNLMDALVGHTKNKARLGDIDIEIEGDRIERRLRLSDLKRKQKGVGQDDEISELDRKITIAQKRKALAELEGSGPAPKTKTPEELAEERLSNLSKQQRYRAREQAVKLFGQFETRKEIEREVERRKNEILKSRKPEQLSEEEREYIEDIEDAKSYALGRI